MNAENSAKSNLKYDLLWVFAVGIVMVMMLVPPMADGYQWMNVNFPYMTAFLKFMILAPMGELLARRIRTGRWKVPSYIIARALVWGFLGMVIALAFQLFSGGVMAAIEKGFLPQSESALLNAFMISAIMNVIFAPVMMAFHRFTDTFFDLRSEGASPTLNIVVERIDWGQFFAVIVAKTIPFFWIPAHTITFLLPVEYRVMMAAVLSIALGMILALAKRKS